MAPRIDGVQRVITGRGEGISGRRCSTKPRVATRNINASATTARNWLAGVGKPLIGGFIGQTRKAGESGFFAGRRREMSLMFMTPKRAVTCFSGAGHFPRFICLAARACIPGASASSDFWTRYWPNKFAAFWGCGF